MLLRLLAAVALAAATASASVDTASSPPVIDDTTQYSVIMDAGSTGTRIYIYTAPAAHPIAITPLPTDVTRSDQWSVETKPGIASLDPEAVDAYLTPLLVAATNAIPASHHNATVIALRATAGMRLVSETHRLALMRAARVAMRAHTPFIVDQHTAATTISGDQEALSGWLTANHLSHRLVSSTLSTVAYVDLGGASTQIAFEPPKDQPPLVGGYPLQLPGALPRAIYTHSYLRLGIVQARGRYYSALKSKQSGGGENMPIPDPCSWRVASATTAPYNVTAINVDSASGTSTDTTVVVQGTGSPKACARLIRSSLLLPSPAPLCSQPPCSVLGVYQPVIPSHMPIYAVSSFARMAKKLKCATAENDHTAPLSCLRDTSNRLCTVLDITTARSHFGHIKDEDELYRVCFEAVYMVQLASLAFRIPFSQPIRWSNDLGGSDLGWTLGAVILDRAQNTLLLSSTA